MLDDAFLSELQRPLIMTSITVIFRDYKSDCRKDVRTGAPNLNKQLIAIIALWGR